MDGWPSFVGGVLRKLGCADLELLRFKRGQLRGNEAFVLAPEARVKSEGKV